MVLAVLLASAGTQVVLAQDAGPSLNGAISPTALTGDCLHPSVWKCTTQIYQSGTQVYGVATVTSPYVWTWIRVYGQLHVGNTYYGTQGDVTCYPNKKTCTLTVHYTGTKQPGEQFDWHFKYY